MKKRLLQIADYLNISIRGMEQKSRITRGVISNMSEDGEIGSGKLAKIIVTFPEINPMWILNGDGEMLRQIEKKTIEKIPDVNQSKLIATQERLIDSLSKEIKNLEKENAELKKAKEPTLYTGMVAEPTEKLK